MHFLISGALFCVSAAAMAQAIPPQAAQPAADLANHVYSLKIAPGALVTGPAATALKAPPGYTVTSALNNPESGFQGATYKHSSGRVIVAIQGTNPKEPNDFKADAALGFQPGSRGDALARGATLAVDAASVPPGDPSAIPRSDAQDAYSAYKSSNKFEGQLADARRLTDSAVQAHGASNVTLTGHSLGGALAQVESARTGLSATTFDAPGMRDYIAAKYPNADATKITNLSRQDDMVNRLNKPLGVSTTYPGVDAGVTVIGPDGKVQRDGRITATLSESAALLMGGDGKLKVWGTSEIGANHDMNSFRNELRSGAKPVGPSTFQDLAGPARPVTESDLRSRFNAQSSRNAEATAEAARAAEASARAAEAAAQARASQPPPAPMFAIPTSPAPPARSTPITAPSVRAAPNYEAKKVGSPTGGSGATRKTDQGPIGNGSSRSGGTAIQESAVRGTFSSPGRDCPAGTACGVP